MSGADPAGGWEPNEEVLDDVVAVSGARKLHGLLDAPGPAPVAGDHLPVLWHWLSFTPDAPQRALGEDGHPRTGSFLPPAPFPRRMFAGSDLTVEVPLVLGSPAVRRGIASYPEEKSGKSGSLAFVSVTYDYAGGEGAGAAGHLVEQQQVVYRPASAPGTPAPPRPTEEVPAWPWRFELAADERLLFRFSALTYNAHRIHYDLPYVTGVEGYPGLVVHGPLLAIGLAELLRRHAPDRLVRRFSFRAAQPAFAPTTLRFVGREGDGGAAELVAYDGAGTPLMRATADLVAP